VNIIYKLIPVQVNELHALQNFPYIWCIIACLFIAALFFCSYTMIPLVYGTKHALTSKRQFLSFKCNEGSAQIITYFNV
jgi:hypothetical protein